MCRRLGDEVDPPTTELQVDRQASYSNICSTQYGRIEPTKLLPPRIARSSFHALVHAVAHIRSSSPSIEHLQRRS